MTTTASDVLAVPVAPVAPVAPTRARASAAGRWRTMARIGLRMMFHDKIKLPGTLVGVVFAVILIDQQSGAGLYRNSMYVDHANADLWISSTRAIQIPPVLMLATLGGALVMCVLASTFAALRIRSLECSDDRRRRARGDQDLRHRRDRLPGAHSPERVQGSDN